MKKKLKKKIIDLLKKKEDSDNVFIEEVRGNLSDFKSLLSEVKPTVEKKEVSFKSIDLLKDNLIERYRKLGETRALVCGRKSYTGNQMADEIENETEEGIRLINSVINLTIEMLSRDKLKMKEDEGTK